jgi:hypothetical protein
MIICATVRLTSTLLHGDRPDDEGSKDPWNVSQLRQCVCSPAKRLKTGEVWEEMAIFVEVLVEGEDVLLFIAKTYNN